MFTYEYRCTRCGRETEAVRRMSERLTKAPECCGERMAQVFLTPPVGFVDNMDAYRSPATGEVITSRRQRRYEMEKNDLIDANDFAKSYEQRKAEKERNQAEIAAIKAEMPKDLKKEVQQITKQEADRFKSGL